MSNLSFRGQRVLSMGFHLQQNDQNQVVISQSCQARSHVEAFGSTSSQILLCPEIFVLSTTKTETFPLKCIFPPKPWNLASRLSKGHRRPSNIEPLSKHFHDRVKPVIHSTKLYVVVKNNPNIPTYVWEEKYSSDTLTRRKITVWSYNQKNKMWQRTLHAQLSLLVFCLTVLAVNFYYWALMLRIMGKKI